MSTAAGGNAGRIFARLKPRSERKSAQEIIQELRGKLAAVPGINAFPQMLPTIRIGGQLTKSQYQFTLQAPDTNELYQDAPKLEAKLRTDPQFQKLLQDVTSDLQITNPQVNVDIDRDKASALGVTANQVEDALYTAYGAAADLHHLRSQQCISRHHRTGESIPARSFGAVNAVCARFHRATGSAECGGASLLGRSDR